MLVRWAAGERGGGVARWETTAARTMDASRWSGSPAIRLARAGIGRGELAVGAVPDAGNAAAGADEKCCRGQCHKRHQQGVLDQVLSLVIVTEIANCSHVHSPIPFIQAGSCLRKKAFQSSNWIITPAVSKT